MAAVQASLPLSPLASSPNAPRSRRLVQRMEQGKHVDFKAMENGDPSTDDMKRILHAEQADAGREVKARSPRVSGGAGGQKRASSDAPQTPTK
eukprot:CAMPEP_0114134242 /NCGR_PEP_ID=MMETSP0043_2-20121206/14050_1 /TAXON_ID=464988 /ORGANISM="Hemiselmis andersenii, Strain CCMP644" /LENGTH=92 /DNA_ID=CAMNT_0001227863 /DNA_START=258 /DNA_END=533 /DNA_ORIENTATION=+